jgi:predicted HTH domain antitoxin
MEVTLHIPDEVAKQLVPEGGDLSRRALEALAIDGYRKETLGLYQVSQMLGLTRIEAEDFLGRNQVPLANLTVADLDRDAAAVEAAFRRRNRS